MKDGKGKNTTEDSLRQKLKDFQLPVEDSVFENIRAGINDSSAPGNSNKKKLRWAILALAALIGIVLIPVYFWYLPESSIETTPKDGTPVPQSNFPKENGSPEFKQDRGEQTPNANSTAGSENGDFKTNEVNSTEGSPDVAQSAPELKSDTKSEALKSASKAVANNRGAVSDAHSGKAHKSGKPDQSAGKAAKSTSNNTSVFSEEDVMAGSGERNTNSENGMTNQPAENQDSTSEKSLVNSNNTALVSDTLFSDADTVTADKAKQETLGHSGFALLVQGGLGISYRSLSIDPLQELERHKDDHEQLGLSFNYSIGLRYYFSDKVYMGSGIGYASFSERYAFHHNVISHTTVNRYKYLQVPLMLGLRLWDSEKIDVYGRFGVSWNPLLSAQSSWVDPQNLTPVSHSNSGAEHPFQDNTFEGIAGFDLIYTINHKWRIHLMPQGGIFLNSVYLNSTQLNQKPYAGSISLGISREF